MGGFVLATAFALLLLALGAYEACGQSTAQSTTMPVPTMAPAVESALDASMIRRIVAHGPWPPPTTKDPSNRVSGQTKAVGFGAKLFADPRLSRDGRFSCASCHQPDRAFTDGRARGEGHAASERNTISLVNVGQQRWYGWSGANDNLWAQSLRPMLDAREMGGSEAGVAKTVRTQPDLRQQYAEVFGRVPSKNNRRVAVDVAKALAAYQETLVSPRTSFDDFRDALVRGDLAAAAAFPAAAQRGAVIFFGDGNCHLCHVGARFSNGEFHDVGVPFFVAGGGVDAGRLEGVASVKRSRYNLRGIFSDDPARSTATSTRHVVREHRNFGEFKVPSLRGVARTAPYMHNGSLATLGDVVRHYSELNEDRLHADGERLLKPLRLTPQQSADLVAFLETL